MRCDDYFFLYFPNTFYIRVQDNLPVDMNVKQTYVNSETDKYLKQKPVNPLGS